MGASQSTTTAPPKLYNRPVAPPDTEGSSPIYQSIFSADLVSNLQTDPVSTCADFFLRSVKARGENAFLGMRPQIREEEFGPYKWISYNQGLVLANRIGSQIVNQNLVTSAHFKEHGRDIKVVGIFAKNCVEWFLVEQVCNLFGFTICPLYDTLGVESLRHILIQTRMSTLCVDSMTSLLELLNEHNFEHLKHLVLLHDREVTPGAAELLKRRGITWHFLRDWMECATVELAPHSPDPTSVHTICYTSGTGGLPKGCLIEQQTAISVIASGLRYIVRPGGMCPFYQGDRFLSFLPLAHVYERCVCNIVIAFGSSIGVYSGDTKRLVEDIKALRPNLLFAVPRVINKVHGKIMRGVEEKSYAVQSLFNSGLESKVKERHTTGKLTHGFWDRVAFKKVREILNPELRMMVSGGAPLHPTVADETSCCFSLPVIQGYGLTESFGPCFLSYPSDTNSASVGAVWPCIEFKLVSIPELKTFVSDKPPRGEICLRGPGVVKEYLCHMNTENLWDENGWYHTGDIAVMLPNNAVQIVGRRRQVFKLSQGEYIMPERIENIYAQSKYIEQIVIAGNSFKTHPVALVVPSLEAALQWAEKNSINLKTLNDFCALLAFEKEILADMESVAKANNLKGFEKPAKCLFVDEPFSPENARLTPTMKVVRQRVLDDYRDALEEMYAAIV